MGGAIVMVMHDEFQGMGLSGVSGFLGVGAVVVDVMGMIDAGDVEEKGFYYRGL
ncbi:MAG: hypothetical protein U9N61_07980 [Euryarchaeota archaeon]|nr:hypothetical protein [Euryarchaeota archaeon]MEA1999243.1 hypothetical protein [Euryarchaeota archaeon]